MRSLITGVFLSAAFFSLQACSTTEEGATNDERVVSAETQQEPTGKVQQITAADFNKVKTEKNAIVIDVRTPGEVAEGYIDGATKFIDVNGANFATEIAKLDKSAEYIIYCRSGARSMNASNYMVQNGFTNVYNLQGGILGWNGKIVK
jgi:rhodanese-related sulfurtransferase